MLVAPADAQKMIKANAEIDRIAMPARKSHGKYIIRLRSEVSARCIGGCRVTDPRYYQLNWKLCRGED
jgi:hypothetical protein